MCAGFSSAFNECNALLCGSSPAVRKPPFVSVILLKSYSTNLVKFRAGWISSRGRKPPGFAAGVVLRASRRVEVTPAVVAE